MIKKIIKFITSDIWKNDRGGGKWINDLINELKVFIVTFNNYGSHQIGVRSAALTFYTLISLVPVTAMVLGLSKGFGLDAKIIAFLQESFSSYDIVITKVSEFANSFLENSKLGIFAGVSVVVLLWSVFMVFFNIEQAFNHIWEIKNKRPISRRISDYLAIVISIPVLYSISVSVKDFVDTEIVKAISNNLLLQGLYKGGMMLFYLIVVWLLFSVIYIVLPNTKVKFKAAFHAGIVAGSAYLITQYGYLYFQTSVSNYSIVYGSFAALPLFLLWLSICWQIILFGAEFSFVYQNIKKYEYERYASNYSNLFTRKLIVLIVRNLTNNFLSNSKPMSSQEIADQTKIPIATVREIIYTLTESKIIYSIDNPYSKELKTSYYIMGVDTSTLTVGGLIDMVDNCGKSSIQGVDDLELLEDLNAKRDTLIKEL
ncbi:MAG: YihY/virulence factor BrkB family protein [Rikenellaceae bacterium]